MGESMGAVGRLAIIALLQKDASGGFEKDQSQWRTCFAFL